MKKFKVLLALTIGAVVVCCGCGRVYTPDELIPDTTNNEVESADGTESTEGSTSAKDLFNSDGGTGETTEAKEVDFKTLISADLIDLTTEPNSDVVNANWVIEDGYRKFEALDAADLEMTVLNRKVTITGTTIGDFLKTFEGTQDIIDIDRVQFDKDIYPYQGVSYRFVLQEYPAKELEMTAYNLTGETVKLSDCILYHLSWKCDDGVNNYKVINSLYDENGNFEVEYKSGTSEKFNYTVGVYDSIETMVYVEVDPLLVGDALEYVKSLSNPENYIAGDVENTLGDGMISIIDYTFDIKKSTVPDFFSVFATENTIVPPVYYAPVYISREYAYGEEVDYTLQGYSDFSYDFNGHSLFVTTRDVFEGNLYEAPLGTIKVDINFVTNKNEFVNLAGITNLTTSEELVKWYNESVKEKVSFELEDGSDDELDFSIIVEDQEFLDMFNNNEIADAVGTSFETVENRYRFGFLDNGIEEMWLSRDCD